MLTTAPTGEHSPPPNEAPGLDGILMRLQEQKRAYARLSIDARIGLLRDLLDRTARSARAQVQLACDAKRIQLDSPVSAEEWLAGPMIQARHIRLFIESLQSIKQRGVPPSGLKHATRAADGSLAVEVFPASLYDRALYNGFRAWTWLDASFDRAGARERQASFYQEAGPEGGVSLVLGAGNVASIAPLDVLHKLIVEGRVVILKMNPVNDYLGPIFEEQFATFIARGYMAVVYGGVELGRELVAHPLVDDIHVTGSHHTHDAIVWGPPGPDRDARISSNTPRLDKAISSELGNITPILVTPGPYSKRDLDVMARNIAAMVVNNASFNCNAGKLLVLPRHWMLREPLLARIGRILESVPSRYAYYPGAASRFDGLTAERRDLRLFGERGADRLPWALIASLDAQDQAERSFQIEPFCSVLSEVSVGSGDPLTFLDEAVRFVNDRVWGTLAAGIFIHPKHEQDPGIRPAFDQAIARLRYGAVAINHWPALAYGLGVTPWGAAPDSPLDDIQSGRGFVHNTPMLEGVRKTVVRGPLHVRPSPIWYPGHRNAHEAAERLARFEAKPSARRLPGVALKAISS